MYPFAVAQAYTVDLRVGVSVASTS